VQFDRFARTAIFMGGLERVHQGMKQFRIALLCAEKEPLACHRTILVARALSLLGVRIRPILSATESEDHRQTEERLLLELRMNETNLFADREELIIEAFQIQGRRIASERTELQAAVDRSNGTRKKEFSSGAKAPLSCRRRLVVEFFQKIHGGEIIQP
jgi:hypothetical protein